MRHLISILIGLQVLVLSGQDLGIQVDTYQLDNGLTVYLNEDENATNVYGSIWVNAGGKNDPAEATGIAHYLEHMLFKGTQELGTQNFELEKIHLDSIKLLYDDLAKSTDKSEKLNIQKKINEQELKASQYAIPNEFDKLIKSIGSTGVNASTGEDYTNYYNYFPANQIAKWLDIYAHRFQNPVFRLFQSELEAVYEEKNRAGDNLERRVQEKFASFIYGDHPYSTQTVLGSVEHLKNPSLSKMYEYFEKYYVANNMALVLSGNFDSKTVKPLIEKSFGELKRGEELVFPSYTLKQFNGRELQKVRITPIKAGFMGYKLVPRSHSDYAALAVIGDMMSNENETGFLDQLTLNNEVLYAGAYQEFLEEDGSTFIFYVPKVFGKNLKKFESIVQEGFADIAKGDFTQEYFESIKNGIYRNFNTSLEELGNRGRYMGLSFIYGVSHEHLLSLSDEVQDLTKEEVQRVAAKYYGNDYFTMRSHTGFPKKTKLEKPSYSPISARTEASSAYAQRFEKVPVQESNPKFIDLDKDVSLYKDYIYHTKNPLNDVFTLRMSIAKGVNREPLAGLIAEALNNSGTSKYSAGALKRKFASLGATYSFDAEYTTFNLTVQGLDEKFSETIELIEHVFDSFNPTEETMSYLYNQQTTENKISSNNPSSAGRILYVYGLFGDQSSYLNRVPVKDLKQLDPSALKSTLGKLIGNGFNAIHYVGQLPKEEVASKWTSSDLFSRNEIDQYAFMQAQEVSENTIYLVNDKKAIQSYVYYIVNGEALNYEETYKKNAFNAYYTNSLSGLLFQEVREFRSLAYATGGNYIDPTYEPNKKGRLVLFTGSQADKTANAVEVVMGLLTDMPSYEERLVPIRDGLVLKTSASKPAFRELSQSVDAFLNSGYQEDPNKINFEKYPDLTFDDIQSFYQSNIKGKPIVVTVYGDASRIDMDQLRKFGKVIKLDMKDIMVE